MNIVTDRKYGIGGEYQLTNGLGPDQARQVMNVSRILKFLSFFNNILLEYSMFINIYRFWSKQNLYGVRVNTRVKCFSLILGAMSEEVLELEYQVLEVLM